MLTVAVVLVLVLLNGVFALSELAVVSARARRLGRLCKRYSHCSSMPMWTMAR